MKKHSSQLNPEQDALQHIAAHRDKPFLVERVIDSSKGRGVFTRETIEPSTFVVEYRGKISRLGTRPDRRGGDALHGFLYKFSWSGSRWCVDAPRDDGSLGRLVNDDHIGPNCITKKIAYEGKPHLCLFAVKKIAKGEEITFNYGNFSYSWRSNVEDSDKSSSHEDDENDESLPGPSLDNEYSPDSALDSSEEMAKTSKLQLDSDSLCQKKKKKKKKNYLNSERDLDRADNASDKTISFTTKNYCYVCGKGYSAIGRHLASHADEEPDIAQAFASPKDSGERKKLLKILRNRGNYKHNQEVMKNKGGLLKVRCKTNRQSVKEYTTCWYCKGMFIRQNLKFHLSRCVKLTAKPHDKSGIESEPSDAQHLERLTPEVSNMLSSMEPADVSSAIKSDDLLVQLARILFEKYRHDPSKQGFIRQNLRDMGRLRLALHKWSLIGFVDALKSQNIFKLSKGVKLVAGFDKNKQVYKKPSLALNLGILLKRIAMLVIASPDSEKDMVRHARIFIQRYATEWFKLVSQLAIISLTERKASCPSTIQFTRDVQAFYLYLEKTSASAIEKMETSKSPKVYSTLCRVTLAQASVLSKCATEVSEMTVKSFQERDNVTQVLSKHFTRINIQDKTGQTVPVLLTSDLFRALMLLVNKRQTCGVHHANPFLFARPDGSSSSLYHAGDCIREFSTHCGAKNPEHLGSEYLYKYMARIFQILNLENDELERLGKLLDHSIRTERDYYRSPEAAVQLAKIAKLIQAMKKGSLEGFKGNSLEEVMIEEKLEPDVEQKARDLDSSCRHSDDVEQRDVTQGNGGKANASKNGLNDAAASPVGDRVGDQWTLRSSPSSNVFEEIVEGFTNFDSSDHEYILSDEDLDEGVTSLEDASSLQQEALNSADDSDSDGGSNKTRGGRKHFCYVCGKPQSKISRHLFTHRQQEPDIAEAFALHRNSKARKLLLKKLRNRAHEKHQEKVGQLLSRHKTTGKSKEQAACIYCKAMYDHKEIWQHIQKCHMKNSSTPQKKTRLTSLAADTGLPDPKLIPADLRNVLKRLKKDEIGAVVKKDPYILQLAQSMYYSSELEKGPTYLKSRLRLLGRLLLALKKKSINSFEEVLKPQNLPCLRETVNQIAAQSKAVTPLNTIPFRLGSMITKIADIRFAKVVRQEAAKETLEEAATFLKLCAKEWPRRPALPISRGVPTLQFVRDVQTFYRCLVDTTASAVHTLSLYVFPQVYTALLKVALAHVSILNKDAGEISKVTLASFKDRDQTELRGEAAGCQSHLERILSMHSVKINVKTTEGKEISLALTDQLLSAFTLLVTKREACAVHQNNPYFFAKPKAGPEDVYPGQACIQFQLHRCERKCHEGLMSVDFRTHVVRIFEILRLTNEGLDQLAKLLGREIQTDSEFYQKPEAAADVAKLSELVLAMKTGSLQRFEGKSLEEIEIPDELLPVVEMEEDEDLEMSLHQNKTKTKRKRRSSSLRRQHSHTSTKKQKKETEGIGMQVEGDDQSTEKEKVPPEKMSDKFDINVPEDERVSSSKRTETHVSFSDDDVDMDVDFDLDTDDDNGQNENDASDFPAKPEVKDAEELEDSSGTKREDNPTNDLSSRKDPGMNTGNHSEEDDSVEEDEEEDDCMDTNCDSPAHLTPVSEKKNNFTSVLRMMKEVKVLIPKLDIAKLDNQLGDTKSPQTHGSPATDKNQIETPSTQNAVTDDQSCTKAMCMTCSFCKKTMVKGQTAFQKKGYKDIFCSRNCLFGMYPHNAFKTCHHCQKTITKLLDLIMAAVDNKGSMKNFCSPACLCSFKYKSVSILTPQQVCSRCNKPCTTSCELTSEETVHSFCSDACLEDFCRDKFGECEECRSACRNKPLRLKFEGGTRTVCSDDCLRNFTEGVMTPHQCTNCSASHPKVEALQLCHTCQTPHQISDMVEQENDEGRLEFFCSSRCLMMYRSHSLTVPENESVSPEEDDVEDIKPLLLSLDSIKEEPIDDTYNQNPQASAAPDIKDEPYLLKEEVKLSSDFPPAEESSSTEPTPTNSSESCSTCEKVLMDGEMIYQRKGLPDTFCSTACLVGFHQIKQRKPLCFFCLQALPESQDVCHGSVDKDGTEKDFCSETCLSSFNCKKIASIQILNDPLKSQCSICCRHCISKHEVMLKKIVYKVCSDPCYLRFCTINNMSICELCRRCCQTPLVLKMENDRKTLCSEECVSEFKQKIQTPQQCAMCRTSVLISDMYENKISDNVIELFCTKGCVTASKIQAVSASGAAFNCDKCGRTSVPACHLAMADATIRNFCSLTCAKAFKKTQKDNTSATNSTEASSQTWMDSHKPPQKLLCAQCRRILRTLPKVIYMKEKLIFVCSSICSQDFQRINIIRGKCENCKTERIIKEIKKVDGRCLSFCSDGCEALSLLQLEKTSGQRVGSCSYCLSRFRTLRTAADGGTENEFCSEDCCSKYKLCLSHMAKCDSCGHQGKLKQRLALLGEVKHFCDLKCLLGFCYKVAQGEITELIPPTDPSPVITSVVSLAEALVRRAKSSSASAQDATTEDSPVVKNVVSESAEEDKSSVFDMEAEVVGHVSTQTVQKEMKNKSLLCTPLVHNKGVSCAAQTVETEAQTDKVDPDIIVLPVPVFVPLPMNLYTQYTPTPVALPLPLPVPVFLPLTADDAKLTSKEKSKMFNGDQSLRPETETGDDDRRKMEDEPPTGEVINGGEGNLFKTASPCSSAPGRLPSSTSEEKKDQHRPELPPPVLLHKVHRKKGSELQRTSSEVNDVRVASRKPHKLQTQWGVDAWKTWIQWRESQTNTLPLPMAVGLKEELLHCSAEELSHGLCCFVNEVKQENGEEHPPDSLFYLCLCIQQYLFENNRTENIFSDLIYSRFSSEFTKIMKHSELSLTGGGCVPSCVDENFLWECKQLGAFSPIVLLNTLLFFSCKFLGFTSVEQHRRLAFTQIRSFRRTKGNNVTTFLRFYLPNIRKEEQSDTDGVAARKRKKNEEQDSLEMTENSENPLRCPVRLYKFYLSKCPQSVRQRGDLFYLRPDHGCVPSSPRWFSPTPLDDATMEAVRVRVLAVREIQEQG